MLIIYLINFIFIATILAELSPEELKKKYCTGFCGVKHLICVREGDCHSINADCQELPIDDTFRYTILNRHNEMRNKVALGLEKRGGNSEASNMNAISYDEELELISKCAATTCDSSNISQCHSSKTALKNAFVSEVYLMDKHQLYSDDFLNFILKKWADEAENTTTANIDSFDYNHGIHKYANMLNGRNTLIGCGHALKFKRYYYLFCFYNKRVLREDYIYKRGKACSDCYQTSWFPPENQCYYKTYKGLCGKVYMFDRLVNGTTTIMIVSKINILLWFVGLYVFLYSFI